MQVIWKGLEGKGSQGRGECFIVLSRRSKAGSRAAGGRNDGELGAEDSSSENNSVPLDQTLSKALDLAHSTRASK